MRLRFLGLELDDQRRELRREGSLLAVEPRVFDLISYLIRSRDRLVTKDELLEELWPDSIVQDGALSVCVHRARRLLESDGATAIQTVARRGYRFVARIDAESEWSPAARPSVAGRDSELGALLSIVEDLAVTRLRTAEVTGPAGAGKTALLEGLGTEGRRRHLEVLRAAPADGDEPFSLWVQVISAYVARHNALSIPGAMGDYIDELATIVPTLRRWASPAWHAGSEPSRERLFQAVNRSLYAATASRPVLLLFDDVDRADGDSMVMMRRVLEGCRNAPTLIVIAYRDATPTVSGVVNCMHEVGPHLRLDLGQRVQAPLVESCP
ncbi:MAG TPA: AAA family ATPase [Candidatus Binatia bacterium]|jgi:DNA-binding winged helix-turn-helix (wHTH) protein